MPFNLLNNNGEIQLDDTLLGPGPGYTYDVLNDWNPFPPYEFSSKTTTFGWDMGASGGLDTPGTRKFKWTVLIRGANASGLMSSLETLAYRLSPATAEKELCFQIGPNDFTYYGRPRGHEVVRYDNGRHLMWVECRWEALDPRYYSNTTITFTDNAHNFSLGPNIPTVGAVLSTASAPTPWQIIIRPNGGGTITNPRLTNPTIFDAPFIEYSRGGTSLPGNKELYIDTRKRTIVERNHDGSSPEVADASANYQSVWWDFQARTDETGKMNPSSTGGTAATATIILTYRKANL